MIELKGDDKFNSKTDTQFYAGLYALLESG